MVLKEIKKVLVTSVYKNYSEHKEHRWNYNLLGHEKYLKRNNIMMALSYVLD